MSLSLVATEPDRSTGSVCVYFYALCMYMCMCVCSCVLGGGGWVCVGGWEGECEGEEYMQNSI